MTRNEQRVSDDELYKRFVFSDDELYKRFVFYLVNLYDVP